jgi:hypothetical protein
LGGGFGGEGDSTENSQGADQGKATIQNFREHDYKNLQLVFFSIQLTDVCRGQFVKK